MKFSKIVLTIALVLAITGAIASTVEKKVFDVAYISLYFPGEGTFCVPVDNPYTCYTTVTSTVCEVIYSGSLRPVYRDNLGSYLCASPLYKP